MYPKAYNISMSKDIFEKAVSAIQRDRLENFIKDSFNRGGGCFGTAAVSCHNYLYPNLILPRHLERQLIQNTEGAKVKLVDVISELEKLEPYLKIKVDRIINHTNLTLSYIEGTLSKQDGVLVKNSEDGWLYPEPGVSTAITFLQSKKDKKGGHYMPLVENSRFYEEGLITGGDTEYQRIKDRYTAGISFIVVKSI